MNPEERLLVLAFLLTFSFNFGFERTRYKRAFMELGCK